MSTNQRDCVPPNPPQHVRFDLPPALQTFTCFPRLPVEIQDQIWESTVDDPGVHWLKVEQSSWRSLVDALSVMPTHVTPAINNAATEPDDEEEIDPIQRECQHERPSLSRIRLSHPDSQRADKSWHRYVQDQMAAMAVTSRLAHENFERITRNADIQRSVITPEGRRQFTMLDTGRDLAFIEYVPSHIYQSDCGLGVRFEAEHLSSIRNVAVKYHQDWHVEEDAAKRCPRCGRYHGSTRPIMPKHLYQFLARSFPKLESVWLVDYMMVPKSKNNVAPECRCGHPGPDSQIDTEAKPHCQKDAGSLKLRTSPRLFRATDRTFYEANPEAWLVKDRVIRIRDWVRDSYVRYSKFSKYACHKAPETVKFGILGCKHHDPTYMRGETTGKVVRRPKRQADRDPVFTRKLRRKLSLSSDHGVFTFYFDKPFQMDQLYHLPMHYFGSGTLKDFDFEFELGELSLEDQHLASAVRFGRDRHGASE